MVKRSKLTTFTVFVLIITMIALILVSGTYAKYTKEVEGTATATVAKFAVGGVTETSFNLFDTIYEEDGSTQENEVLAGKIAPGTGGKFAVTLTSDSEVAVDYTLSIKETNASGVPIEYSIDGQNYYTAANISNVAQGTLAIGSTTQQTVPVTFYWRWAYEGASSSNYTQSQDDNSDTTLGTMSTAPTVSITTTVVFEQAK